jgi:hypothetical protein
MEGAVGDELNCVGFINVASEAVGLGAIAAKSKLGSAEEGFRRRL